MYNLFFIPSFYAHVLNALLLLFAVVLLYRNYSAIRNLEPYKLIVITLLFSIGVGMHGLSHLGLEKTYHYNPLVIN